MVPQSKLPTTFVGLHRRIPLRREIKSKKEFRQAQEMIDALLLTERNEEQDDYFYFLCMLVHGYEKEHHAIDTSDLEPIELLKFLLKENDLNAADLGRILTEKKDPSLGSRILRSERDLNKGHIEKLSARFKVSPALFFKKSVLETA